MSLLNRSSRRSMLAIAPVIAAAMALLPLPASAQAYPNRPIKMIVPFAPGGGSDVIARAIATKLSQRLGQPIVIDNRAGAGGNLGVEAAARAPADGYDLLFVTTALATNASTGKKLAYDPVKDFSPIGAIGATPLLVVVRTDSPIKTLRDLIETAQAKPNAISFGSGGISSMSHLGMELLAAQAKVQLLHVPYKGIAPAFNDLMAGNVQVALSTFASATSLMEGGKLRGLAVTGAQRSSLAPNLPTASEAGLPGFQIDFWWGIVGPARMPHAVAKRLNEELNAVLREPDTRELLAREAAVPTPGTPEQFGKLIAFELARWSKLVKDANIKAE